jgi:hypothetical protein
LKKLIFILVFVLVPFCIVNAQDFNNLRTHIISNKFDTIKIDTLSIIPNSVVIRDSLGDKTDTNFYRIDYAKALLVWNLPRLDQIKFKISYRVFPYYFAETFKHKDIKNIKINESGIYEPFIFQSDTKTSDIFKTKGLNKNGSISRGISFGNNQDVVLNSNLNIQLSGKLSEDIDILAAITDNNIPIQPQGNTQQIQDFDKVFIQLSSKRSKLIAGDFELNNPKSYFMKFNKKLQGGSFTTKFNTSKKENKTGKMRVTASAAISKGKYVKNEITGIEGVQGPYKLKGINNESFIIVIAGTERVYIDGVLLHRGQGNDYVINYNLAEITFTPKNPVTKDKRIYVEFEYSNKNYARSLLFFGDEFEQNKLKLRFNIFSEQDIKSQPVENLSDEQKLLLSDIGDNIGSAFSPNVDSIAFANDQVLYKMVDTVVNFIHYDSIFVYSTNQDSAFYRLGFSKLGEGKGNYKQIKTSANGKVFQWVEPKNGVAQGSYEPVTLLVTAKKKQMYSFSADYAFSNNTKLTSELAISNTDINTFSKKDNKDNTGYAFKINIDNKIYLSKKKEKGWALASGVSYKWIDKNFNPIEQFRKSVEFERDWNLLNTNIIDDEHISGIKLSFLNKKTGFVNYQSVYFFKGEQYKGIRNIVNADLNKKDFYLKVDANLVQTQGLVNTSQFFRQNVMFAKKTKFFTIGIKNAQEHNVFKDINTDNLQANSFSFTEYQAFINNADTSANKFSLYYKKRYDNMPYNNELKQASAGESVGFAIKTLKNVNNRLNINTCFRKLSIKDSLLTNQKDENTLLGRVEYFTKLLKGTITSNTFYEIGSGLEVKKEFSYLEVAAGQGVYSWTDYNENGIKELNEFEIAAFKDQAVYIKVYTPTDEYIRAYTNQFNEVLNINPHAVWNSKKGLKKFISRFSNKSVLHINRKTTYDDFLQAYNPFLAKVSDITLVTLNSSFRNIFYFNKTNSKFGMEINYQDSRNKALLTNGFDTRTLTVKGGRLRWNISRKFMFNLKFKNGEKTSLSEYFSSRDYDIVYYETEPTLSYQPNTLFRISLNYKYNDKKNLTESEGKAINHDIGLDIKKNILAKASLMFKLNYIHISYDKSENTPIAFEMLDGLKTGDNIVWNLSYQMNLSKNLQLSIMYNGRKSPEVNTIHIATVQMRAYF